MIIYCPLGRTINMMVNVSYLWNSSGRVEVIGFSQFEALRPVNWCSDFAEDCPNVYIVNKLPVIVNIQFSRDFKEQTGDRNSHKNKGSSISFLEIPTMVSNLTPRNRNKFVSRQKKPPKYPDSIAQFLNSKKPSSLLKNAIKEPSEMALIVISSMNWGLMMLLCCSGIGRVFTNYPYRLFAFIIHDCICSCCLGWGSGIDIPSSVLMMTVPDDTVRASWVIESILKNE
jgi:hypothetical protein